MNGAEVFDRIANRLSDREGEIAVSHGILVANLAPGAVLPAARLLRDEFGFDVLLDVKAPEGLTIRSGYSAVSEIELDRREAALVLPERVVDFRGAKAYVQVPDGSGGRMEREIETGLSDGLTVEIVRGLEEGNEVLEKVLAP